MTIWLWTGIFGAAGALLRFGLSAWLSSSALEARFAISLLLVNGLGAFLLGWLSGAGALSTELGYALGAGFCGSLTTFSTVMLHECEGLRRHGGVWLAKTVLLQLVVALGLFVIGEMVGGIFAAPSVF